MLLPTAVASWARNMAQRLLSLPLLNIMQYLSPVTVLALSWPLLGESISLFRLAGALLVIFGVGIDPALLDEWKKGNLNHARRRRRPPQHRCRIPLAERSGGALFRSHPHGPPPTGRSTAAWERAPFICAAAGIMLCI